MDMDVSANDARRLVQEYRKFLYLKALDGGVLSPPPDLDEVWHKHIESPDGDWAAFCRTVIGKPLEHRTGLSRAEARAARESALALYVQEFGTPSMDIWPGPAENLRYGVGMAIFLCGVLLCAGGHLAMFAAIMLGFKPTFFWIPYTFLGGIGIAAVGALLGRGARVARLSNCG